MSTGTGTSLRVSRVIKAGPEKVFDAWTQPEHQKRWSCPEGMEVADAQVDLTVGGSYLLRMESPEGKVHTAVGVYREIERPRRLVYTWDWEEESIGETIVTVEFNDLGGSTEVMVTHELFPNAEAKVGHEEGWTSCLNRLERLFG
jgi:uncharacterized protein YndB with AHSA1/START domain